MKFSVGFLFSLRLVILPFAFASGAAVSMAHELTRTAYENSLDPREEKMLAQTRSLRAVASSLRHVTATCRLTLQLLDSDTRQSRPGLVRVTDSNGRVVLLTGLVSRGAKLRADHPAKDWHALVGSASISVPQEALTIEAFSGLDTELVRTNVNLSGKQKAEVRLNLPSILQPSRTGWFGGNTHLHLSGLTREQADDYLRAIPRADGLDLLFVSYLERTNADRDYVSNGYSLADLQRFDGHGLLFGNGEEHRHNFDGFAEGYGHVMFLNIRRLVKPVSIGPGIMGGGPDWPPLRRGIMAARGDAATVIWCHNNFGREDVPDWLSGLLDAHNIFDGGIHGTYEDTFYRYLNIGLKVPFSTGTDWFLYDFSRVYVRLEKALSVQNWLTSLAAGKTFISNGPFLEFHAGQSEIGDTIRFSKATQLPISGRAKARRDFKQIELVHNGVVVRTARSHAVGGHFEAELDSTLTADESGWVALRVSAGAAKNEMGETLFAHTSPIYFEVRGRSIFKKEAGEALIDDMEKSQATILTHAKFDHDNQREEVLKIYRDGIETLRKKLSE